MEIITHIKNIMQEQDWFFEGTTLYVPERVNEDARQRQILFGVQGLDDNDLILSETDGKKYYKMGNVTELKTPDCPKDCFSALCYSYIFQIGNSIYLRNGVPTLVDERPIKNETLLLPGMNPPSRRDATKVVSNFESAFDKLIYIDDISHDTKCDLMERLFSSFSKEGVRLEDDEVGVCWFCKGDCNINSQCCGRCARSWAAYSYESDWEDVDPSGSIYE